MEGLIVIGVLVVGSLVAGIALQRSMKVSGGCGCGCKVNGGKKHAHTEGTRSGECCEKH